MGWSVRKQDDQEIVDILYYDRLSLSDIKEATRECYSLMNPDQSTSYLLEFQNATFDFGVSEIFSLPDLFKDIGFKGKNKLAIIISDNSRLYNIIRFFVLTATVRGWPAKRFDMRHQAVKWLLE